MARLFDSGSSEYLERDQAVVTGYPFAASTWFNVPTGMISHIWFCGNDGVTNNWCSIELRGEGGGLRAFIFCTNNVYATAGANYTINTWQHAVAIFVSATDRRVFVNGGNKGTNADAVGAISGWDTTALGSARDSTPGDYLDGYLAEAAVWDLSQWPGATDSDKADNFEKIVPSLGKGYTPANYPLGLKSYWDLIRELNDPVGKYNLTASGTVVAAHSPIILPHGVL